MDTVRNTFILLDDTFGSKPRIPISKVSSVLCFFSNLLDMEKLKKTMVEVGSMQVI